MAENSEATSNNNMKEASEAVDPTQKILPDMHEVIVKNQNEQKKFNEEMLEKMRSTDVKIDELSKEQQEMKILIRGGTKRKPESEPVVMSIDSETSSGANVTPSAILPATGKSFVLKHVFKNVLEMKEDGRLLSEDEEHFGVSWKMEITRKEEHLGFFLHCLKSKEAEKWSIEVEREQKVLSASGGKNKSVESSSTFESEKVYNNWGRHKFIKWEKMEKDYIKDGKMNAEIHVKINKMIGVYKKNLRNFDESMEKHSDVLLVVKDTKFYVSKLYLATHSPYFDSLFLGPFQESKKSEVKLSGIDADDFQNYLEVLYHEEAIDETTVEGILLVADMYDTPIVNRKCQKFLMEKSGKPLKKKLLMSARYNLEQLKKKCISEIKSTADIKAILPDDIEEMDHSIMAELLKKSLEFNNSSFL